MIKERINIAAVGFDWQRIVKPLEKIKADRIYLIIEENPNEKKSRILKNVKRQLKEKVNLSAEQIKVIKTDIWDFQKCFRCLYKLMLDESKSEIYVNITTGINIVAIAAAMAAFTVGANPYYVTVGGSTKLFILPYFKIEPPKKDYLDALCNLEDKFITSSEWIKRLEKKGLLEKAGTEGETKRRYMKFKRNVVDFLERKKWIEIDRERRDYKVRITEEGKMVREMFC